MSINKKAIFCPICRKENTWREDNLFRPFCSERCKLTDLGEWASNSRHIPGEPVNPESLTPSESHSEDEGKE